MGLRSTDCKRQNSFAEDGTPRPKFEGHVMPNQAEYQNSAQL